MIQFISIDQSGDQIGLQREKIHFEQRLISQLKTWSTAMNEKRQSSARAAPLFLCVNYSRSDEFGRIRSRRVLIEIARTLISLVEVESIAVVFTEIENGIRIIDQWCFNTKDTTNKRIISSPTKNKDETDQSSWHRQRTMETHQYSIEVRSFCFPPKLQ